MLQSKLNRLNLIWKMSYVVIFLLLLTVTSSSLHAQSTGELVNSNQCGENAIIQTFIQGVDGDTRNRITIPQIGGFMRAYAEIWITTSECRNGFPNTLEITSSSGQVLNATPTDITDPGGTERERVYRATFSQPLTSYEITNLRGCNDAVSMTLSVESFRENSASFLVQFNRELDGPASSGGDDCLSFTLDVGAQPVNRNFTVSIPVHEKDATSTDRTVRYTVTSGGQSVSETRTEQNSGPEAAFYEIDITVPANEDRVTFEICSPDRGGDSFGVGAVVLSTTECVVPCPSDFDPGSIEGGFVNCGSYNPSTTFPTTNSVPASNCFGNISYQWIYTSNFNDYIEIPGATNEFLTAQQLSRAFGGSVIESIWLRRRAMCDGCPDFEESNTIDIHINRNFTNAGRIGDEECICVGETPSLINSIEDPSGDTQSTASALEVVWQARTGGSSAPWVDVLNFRADEIDDPNAPFSFQPESINQTTEYRRLVRILPCEDFQISNIVVKQVDTEAPSITNVPGDLTVTCIDDVPAVSDDVVTSDNCSMNTTFTEVMDPQGETCNLTITRTWTATDDCGNQSIETQVITVATDIEADIIADDTNVCNNESVTLEAVGRLGCGDNVGDYTYAWTGPNGFTSAQRIIEVGDLGTYEVVITDSAGCSDSEEVTLDNELCLSIGSTVFVDLNNNGIQNIGQGDVGIEGVTLELWMDGELIATTTTDENGNYFFGALEPGDYVVEVLSSGNMGAGEPLELFHRSSDPTDTADNQQDNDDNGIQEGGLGTDVRSPVINLSPGQEPTGNQESASGGDQDDFQDANGDMTIDFGFIPELSIGSTVFVDNNNNGIQDLADGDVGIPGVTLELWMGGELIGTTTTDDNGDYFFGWLAPGDYVVEILADDNMEAGQPLELFHRSSDPTDTADNQEDGDDNGMQPDGLGTDVSSPVITLSAGDEPTGGAESSQGGNQDNDQDSNGDMTVDFGFIPEFSIGSNVFVDNNDNGLRDAGEEGIEGILVEVFNTGADGIAENADDQLVGSDVTDANGDYFVGWLRPGDFYAAIATPADEFPRSSGPTNLSPDEDVDGDDNGIQDEPGDGVWSNVITLSANDEPTDEPGSGGDQDEAFGDDNGNMTLDFGFTPLVSVGSTVFVDNNDNGIQDPEDDGIEGVTVEVFSVGPDGIAENNDDILVGTDVTDANGNYFVDGLVPGDFYVAIPTVDPDFPVSSTGFADNPNDDVDNDDNGIQNAPGEGVWSNVVTLTGNGEPTGEPGSGGNQDSDDDNNGNMTVDFGFVPQLSVGSTVFADNNDNGIQDPEDDGIEGVTVEVFSVGPDGIAENG